MKKQKLSVSPTKKYKASPNKPTSLININFVQQEAYVDKKVPKLESHTFDKKV